MMIATIIGVAGYYLISIEKAKGSPIKNEALQNPAETSLTPLDEKNPENPLTTKPSPAPIKQTNNSQSRPGNSNNTKTIVPPMDNFSARIALNNFGNEPSKVELSKDQYTDLICKNGKYYPGFHTAVDLEVTPEERNKPLSVYSIADGTIRQAGAVNGYGGLVVVEYKINEKTYTAYYGHVDLKTVTLKAGAKLKAGQKIAELAPACSAANGNTRKHLHFGLRKGSNVVVSGYITSKNDLNNWVDPRTIIH